MSHRAQRVGACCRRSGTALERIWKSWSWWTASVSSTRIQSVSAALRLSCRCVLPQMGISVTAAHACRIHVLEHPICGSAQEQGLEAGLFLGAVSRSPCISSGGDQEKTSDNVPLMWGTEKSTRLDCNCSGAATNLVSTMTRRCPSRWWKSCTTASS